MSKLESEKDFAGKAKTVVRTLCPWPYWKVFWELRISTVLYHIIGSRRTFDLLALNRKTGQIVSFEIKRSPSYAKRSLLEQVTRDLRYCDKVYLVAPERIIVEAEPHLPGCVGLVVLEPESGPLTHEDVLRDCIVRKARLNKEVDPVLKGALILDVWITIASWEERMLDCYSIWKERNPKISLSRELKKRLAVEVWKQVKEWVTGF